MKKLYILAMMLLVIACGPTRYHYVSNSSMELVEDYNDYLNYAIKYQIDSVQLMKVDNDPYKVIGTKIGNEVRYSKYYSQSNQDTVMYVIQYKLVPINSIHIL